MIAKALLIVAIVLLLVWLLRGGRRGAPKAPPSPPAPPPAPNPPQTMARCAHCGLHLPAADAVRGRTGLSYCGEAHRRIAEGSDADR